VGDVQDVQLLLVVRGPVFKLTVRGVAAGRFCACYGGFLLYSWLDFIPEFLVSKVNNLPDFVLSIERPDQGAFLSYFQELDEQVLFLDTSVAYTKFLKQILQQVLHGVAQTGDPHCKNPEFK